MQNSIITIEKTRLVDFLTEIEIYLATNVPEFHDGCSAQNNLENLKNALSSHVLDFHAYTKCMEEFTLNVRGCIRRKTCFMGNPEVENERIHIGQWSEIKKEISPDTSKKELFSIANRLIDEAHSHLSEILLVLCIEVEKKLSKAYRRQKAKS